MLFWFGFGVASVLLMIIICIIEKEKWIPETVGHLFIIIAAILLGPISLFLVVLFTMMEIVDCIDWNKFMNKPLPKFTITVGDKEND